MRTVHRFDSLFCLSFAEGEEEFDWLKRTGFDSLVSLPETASEETTEEYNSMLNSLSIQQVSSFPGRE